jgi:hypothetical protein
MNIRTLGRLIAITIAMSATTKLQKALVAEETEKPLCLVQRPVLTPRVDRAGFLFRLLLLEVSGQC